jgi:flagellar protein FliO/FliZ
VSNVSVAALLFRMVVSLVVVIGLMAAIAKVAKGRLSPGSPKRPGQLEVISRQTIGKNATLTLVRSGDRALLLGVTEHSVSLLDESELPAVPVADDVAQPARPVTPVPLSALVERARSLTVRRA